jgi:hypothetical protein
MKHIYPQNENYIALVQFKLGETMKNKSVTHRAVNWVSKKPTERTDAEAARKYGLKSAASLTHFRTSNGINRAGVKIAPLEG